ncbi:hypothetical protein Ciccas_005570 [Cichlidogyrus casuarinus]|uniref:Uncharacterized protein n=1 Tax=Cichlidogyrus casuarinus TaxID=1844966 RepID=A0ABD2QAM3_9PLAT
MDIADRLRIEHHEAITKLQEMLDNTEALLSYEFVLPQTADMNEAEAATLEYRTKLEKAREELLSKARLQYEQALKAAEEMMEAARRGEASMSEAEELMARAKQAGQLLDKLANSKLQERLEEVHSATVRAVELQMQLAKLTSWNQETEELGVLGADDSLGGLMALDISHLTPDEAIAKLQLHFHSIEEHERALRDAEERLLELKSLGLKNMDISHLETAIAEARSRFEIMRETARRSEANLSRRRDISAATNKAMDKIQTWIDDAQLLFTEESELLENNTKEANVKDKIEAVTRKHESYFVKDQKPIEDLVSELIQCEKLILELASDSKAASKYAALLALFKLTMTIHFSLRFLEKNR